MLLVSLDVIEQLSQIRVIFSNGTDAGSSLVSLRAVYRDRRVRVELLFVTVTMGFASGERRTAHLASRWLRVSKRLTAFAFRESEVQAATSAADARLGPEELLVAAKIAVHATATAEQVAEAIDAAERRVRFVPIARVIYLEPDLLRSKASRVYFAQRLPISRRASMPYSVSGIMAGLIARLGHHRNRRSDPEAIALAPRWLADGLPSGEEAAALPSTMPSRKLQKFLAKDEKCLIQIRTSW